MHHEATALPAAALKLLVPSISPNVWELERKIKQNLDQAQCPFSVFF